MEQANQAWGHGDGGLFEDTIWGCDILAKKEMTPQYADTLPLHGHSCRSSFEQPPFLLGSPSFSHFSAFSQVPEHRGGKKHVRKKRAESNV